MPSSLTLADQYGGAVDRLNRALLHDNTEEFNAALASLQEQRGEDVGRELRALTESLYGAMQKFREDFRLDVLAERDVPDARARLNHVLKLTDEAAHTTMDLIEQCGPLAERTGRGAANLISQLRDHETPVHGIPGDALLDRVKDFLTAASDDCGTVRRNLSEVMLAQTFQDLTGQIIRSVATLVGEVESVLEALLRMTRGDEAASLAPPSAPGRPSASGFGPAVPGISANTVDGQQDVDALMAGLGI